MRAALGGRDKVDVALLNALPAFGQPGHGPVGRLARAALRARERRARQALHVGHRPGEVVDEAVDVVPVVLLAARLVGEPDAKARAEHRLGAQQMAELRERDARRIEVLRVRPEADPGAGVALSDRADGLETLGDVPVPEPREELVPAAPDRHLELLRQGVHDRDADPVQAAREAVVVVRELAARVQRRQDHLDAGLLQFRVHVDRHAAPVVGHLQRAVLVEHHADVGRVPGERLVDAVVDDLLGEVVRTLGVGVHARARPYRVEPAQHLDRGGVVFTAHAGCSCRVRASEGKVRAAAPRRGRPTVHHTVFTYSHLVPALAIGGELGARTCRDAPLAADPGLRRTEGCRGTRRHPPECSPTIGPVRRRVVPRAPPATIPSSLNKFRPVHTLPRPPRTPTPYRRHRR